MWSALEEGTGLRASGHLLGLLGRFCGPFAGRQLLQQLRRNAEVAALELVASVAGGELSAMPQVDQHFESSP